MFDSTTEAILLLIVLAACTVLFFKRKQRIGNENNVLGKPLPGPYGLPLIGNVLQVDGKRAHRSLTKWAHEYGPLYTVKLGSCRALVISDPALIREAFNDPIFSGRPDNKVLNIFSSGGKNGIIAADGNIFSEQKKFTLRHLRNFSFGKSSMESLIMAEVTELIEGFKKEEIQGKSVCVNRKFSLAILNGLWMIVTGKRYSHDDPKLTKILEDLFKTIDKVFSNGALLFIPALPKYLPYLSGWNGIVKAVELITNTFRQVVTDHEKYHIQDNPSDFIDAYLDEIYKTTDPNSSFHKISAYNHLLAVISDLFAAGSETTSNTLTWTILYLAYFKEIQVKLQNEIDSIVGKNRLPSLTDKPNMHFTEAVINEVLRYSETIVLGLFHSTTEESTFHGFYVPKGTYVLSNFYWCHRNPKIWGDPEKFRPERFLENKYDAFMPFSIGKRVCLGETLARDELFLFISSIFQRFDIELDAESKSNTNLLDPTPGFMNVPQKFHVLLKDRIC